MGVIVGQSAFHVNPLRNITMKKIEILGSVLGAGLLQILARGGWETIGHASPSRVTRKEQRARRSFLYQSEPDRTTDARHWHKPSDPHQASRIEAAAAKRERRAERLAEATGHSWSRNYTHHKAFYALEQGHIAPLNLNPFYLAK